MFCQNEPTSGDIYPQVELNNHTHTHTHTHTAGRGITSLGLSE